MIDLVAGNLNKKYLTVLEVGGAYGMRFAGLLEFLEIPYLVITDIDSVDPANKRKNCIATDKGAVSSNATLGYFFKETEVQELSAKTYDECLQADGMRFISYQKPVEVDDGGGQLHLFHGRTLEEAFVYENLVFFQEDRLSIGISLPDDPTKLHQAVWERIKSSTFKKTEFAMDVLSYEPTTQQNEGGNPAQSDAARYWKVPFYIAEGLQWLDGNLSQKQGKR